MSVTTAESLIQSEQQKMLSIFEEQRVIAIYNVAKVSDNERGTHSIDDKRMRSVLHSVGVGGDFSLQSSLCDQTDQSPLFMFMDEMGFESHCQCVSGHIESMSLSSEACHQHQKVS